MRRTKAQKQQQRRKRRRRDDIRQERRKKERRRQQGTPTTRRRKKEDRLDVAGDVGDVVPGVAVEGLLEALLVDVMADEADGAAEDEEAVEDAVGDEFVGFFEGEGAAVSEEVDEADGDAAVHVEDEVGALLRGDLFDGEGEVESGRLGEVLLGELLDDDDAHVRIFEGFDAVADAHDQKVVLLAVVHEVLGGHALVAGLGHHGRGTVQRAAEARADGQQAGHERRHEILAGARRDDRVVRAGDGGAVVGGDHENHLDELRRVGRQFLAEPQQTQNAAHTDVLRKHFRNQHARVLQLFAAVVGDRRDEVGGLADHAEPLGPRVVHRNFGHLRLH
mmetsp:Transcript_29203/g.89337  ORF Transcript_29203/g.89337 Transcript_29203/m.89337 type:complete len:334 (-) Transcript_29203:2531-3532(-)